MAGPIARAYVEIIGDSDDLAVEIQQDLRRAFAGVDRLAREAGDSITRAFRDAALDSRRALEAIDVDYNEIGRDARLASDEIHTAFLKASLDAGAALDRIGEQAFDDLGEDARLAGLSVRLALADAAEQSEAALRLIGEGAFDDLGDDAQRAGREIINTLLLAAAEANGALERIGEDSFVDVSRAAVVTAARMAEAFTTAAGISEQAVQNIGGDALFKVAVDAQSAAEAVVIAFVEAANLADQALDAIEFDNAEMAGDAARAGAASGLAFGSSFNAAADASIRGGGGAGGKQSFLQSTGLSFARSIITGVGFALAGAFAGFVGFGIKVSGEFERLGLQIQNVLAAQLRLPFEEATEAADSLLSRIEDIALRTPFGFQDLAGIAGQLLAAGREAQGLEQDLIDVAGATTFFGATDADLAPLGRAFSQIAGSVRIYQQDLNQITQRLPGFNARQEIAFVAGAEALGYTTEKLAEFRAEGLKTPEAQQAIATGLELIADKSIQGQDALDALFTAFRIFPGASEGLVRQARTLSGQLERIQESAQLALRDGFKPLADFLTGGAAGALGGRSFLDDVSDALRSAVADFAAPIADGFREMAPALLSVFTGLAPIVGGVIGSLLSAVAPLFERLGEFLQRNGEAFSGLLDVILKIAGVLAGAIFTPLLTALDFLFSIIGPLLPLLDFLAEVLERLAPLFVAVLVVTNPWIAALAAGAFVIDHFAEIIDFVGRNLRTFVEILAGLVFPPLAPFILLNRIFDDFLSNPIAEAFRDVAGAIDRIVDAAGGIGAVAANVGKFMGVLALPVVGPFAAVAAGFSALTNIDLGPLDDIAGYIGDKFGAVAGGIGDAFGAVFGGGGNSIGDRLEAELDGLEDRFKSVASGGEDLQRILLGVFATSVDEFDEGGLQALDEAGILVSDLVRVALTAEDPMKKLDDILSELGDDFDVEGLTDDLETILEKSDEAAKAQLEILKSSADPAVRAAAREAYAGLTDDIGSATQAFAGIEDDIAAANNALLSNTDLATAAAEGNQLAAEALTELADALDTLRFPDAFSKAVGDIGSGGLGLLREQLVGLAELLKDPSLDATALSQLAFEDLDISARDLVQAVAASRMLLEEEVARLNSIFAALDIGAAAEAAFGELTTIIAGNAAGSTKALKAFVDDLAGQLRALVDVTANVRTILGKELSETTRFVTETILDSTAGTPQGAALAASLVGLSPEDITATFQPIITEAQRMSEELGIGLTASLRILLTGEGSTADLINAETSAIEEALGKRVAAFVAGRGPLTEAGAAWQAEQDKITSLLMVPTAGPVTGPIVAELQSVTVPAASAGEAAAASFTTAAATGVASGAPAIGTAVNQAIIGAFALASITATIQGILLAVQMVPAGVTAGQAFGTGFAQGAVSGINVAHALLLVSVIAATVALGAAIGAALATATSQGIIAGTGPSLAAAATLIAGLSATLLGGISVITATSTAMFVGGLAPLIGIASSLGIAIGTNFATTLQSTLVAGVTNAVTLARIILIVGGTGILVSMILFGTQIGAGFGNALASSLSATTANAVNVARAVLVTGMLGVQVTMNSLGTSVGNAFGDGITAGIRRSIPEIRAAGAAAAAAAGQAARDRLQIKSPSRVAVEIGNYFGRGIAVGIDGAASAVAASARALSAAAASAAAMSGANSLSALPAARALTPAVLSASPLGGHGGPIPVELVGGGGNMQVVTEPQQHFNFKMEGISNDPEAFAMRSARRIGQRLTNGGFRG